MNDSKYRKMCFLINGAIAWLIYLFMFNKNKNHLLVGGSLGNIYSDNSSVFFEYMLKEKPDKEVYWVLNKNSLAEKTIKNKDKVLYRGSIKAFLYCYTSECIIVSHSFADVMPIFYKFKKQFNIKSVFIGHGIYGFKKAKMSHDNYYSNFDFICSVGEFEQDIKSKSLNLSKDKIKITGLPRYDNLYNSSEKTKDIVVMFTWRESEDKTNYLNAVKGFLTNKELIEILNKNNLKINVVLHSFMHSHYEFINDIQNDYVKILPKDVDIQKELIKNSLLITDYSSVAWDFAYMDKPVLFYHFDLDEYLSERGSYLDLKTELFGDVAYKEDELIKLINLYVDNNFKVSNREFKGIREYIKYSDNKNCERLYENICELTNRD